MNFCNTLAAWALLVGLFASSMNQAHAQAQPYPTKPIRFLVPYAAGGGIDLIARAVAAPLG
jgi:tripartite-type tricarboxylate transporter receptor subunit TctC